MVNFFFQAKIFRFFLVRRIQMVAYCFKARLFLNGLYEGINQLHLYTEAFSIPSYEIINKGAKFILKLAKANLK